MAAVARPSPPSCAGSRHHYMHSTARAPYAVQHDYDYDYDFDSAIPAQYAATPGPSTSGALTPAAALVNSWRTNAAAALESDPYHQSPTDYYRPQSPVYAAQGGYSHRHRSPNRGPKPTRSSRPPSGLSSSNAASGSRLSLDQQYGYPPQSPATTADFVPSSSSHRARIQSATGAVPPLPPPVPAASSQRNHHVHPSSSGGGAQKYSSSHAAASRSSVSLSQHPNSSSRAAGSRYHHSSRNAYDADYDRQLAAGPAAGSTVGSSSSRGLFDPRAQASAGATKSASRRVPGAASSSPRRGHGEDRSRTRHGSSTTSTVSPHPSAASTLHPAPLSSVPQGSAADAHPPSPRSAKRQPGTGERAPRSSATADDRRAARSKREPVQLMDLGRRAGTDRGSRLEPGQHSHGRKTSDAKDSHESLESLQTDFSGRTKSSGAVGGRRRRRAGADGEGEDGEFESGLAGLANAAAGGSNKSRQLFDPRKDDPMRFAAPRPGSVASSTSKHAFPSGLTGSTFTLQTESVMNLPETSGIDDTASGYAPAPSSSSHSKRPDHPILAELKKAYRGILELEKKLQDEHRKVTREAERDADAATGQSAPSAGGVKIQGQGKKYDDAYWVKLAKAHKQLAEAHYSFLQMALDPNIPAGLHSLPQRYNIPTRLWQVAFHQLLERMRHAVVSSPPPTGDDPNEANVLDHLIEFIQFAYTHYSQLFEDPAVSVFRAAWIEQLGDLARYRMAVAGLASRVHAAQEAHSDFSAEALQGREDSKDGRAAAPRARPADAASIGQAALNDWDLEEQETWREMAREWYALGLAESPGTGRLQHHLALLSKGDELRALYHYSKSLTTAHPYQSARESILPLFEEEHQARRTQSDVSQHELFVHLHGMLFTKISLDDFEDCLERFLERLRQEAWSLEKTAEGLSSPHDAEPGLSFADRDWCMLGIINIAALMQYGAEDGVLKKLMTPESGDANDGAAASSSASKRHAHSSRQVRHERARDSSSKSQSAPQALMLKRGDGEAGVTSPAVHDNLEDDASQFGAEADDVVKQLQSAASTEPEDDPLPFKLAQRLAFSILTALLDIPFFRAGHDEVPNPYITIFCTFLAHVSFHPEAMRHLERSVPWEALAALFNRISPPVEIRLDTPSKLVGGKPLPEDHCLRGMDWAGRQLFGRGYWREPRSRSAAASPASGLGTGQGPPIEGIEGTTIRIENEADALRFDLAALQGADPLAARLDDEADDFPIAFSSTAAVLAEGRWRRLAICAAWLVRNVPGFDYNLRAVDASQRFGISGALRIKISRWAREDEEAREAERLSRLALEDRSIPSGDLPSTDDDESDEEDFEDENDSDEVKELKSRRRQLKSIIRQARLATRAPRTSKSGGKARLGSKATPVPHVFPGYTVLVFDTNILLTSLSLLSELVAAECWTIILPLAVITELDGLSRNDSPLGVAAAEAIDYLEQAVRGYSRYLRVQTSRGNYLKDLAIRNEAIDFGIGPDASSTQDAARSLDDVILRAASWQKEHFSNRLALVNPRAVAEGRKVPSDMVQVVLVTFDRNLRLKASARGVEATDEKGLKKAIEAAPIGSGG